MCGVVAARRQHGMNYSRFIYAQEEAAITLNRKVLADLAVNEPFSFGSVVQVVRSPI